MIAGVRQIAEVVESVVRIVPGRLPKKHLIDDPETKFVPVMVTGVFRARAETLGRQFVTVVAGETMRMRNGEPIAAFAFVVAERMKTEYCPVTPATG